MIKMFIHENILNAELTVSWISLCKKTLPIILDTYKINLSTFMMKEK